MRQKYKVTLLTSHALSVGIGSSSSQRNSYRFFHQKHKLTRH